MREDDTPTGHEAGARYLSLVGGVIWALGVLIGVWTGSAIALVAVGGWGTFYLIGGVMCRAWDTEERQRRPPDRGE